MISRKESSNISALMLTRLSDYCVDVKTISFLVPYKSGIYCAKAGLKRANFVCRVVELGASLSSRALNLEGFVAKDAKQNPERTFRHDYLVGADFCESWQLLALKSIQVRALEVCHICSILITHNTLMGSLLRQKKQKACFYCGHRTAQSLSVNVRQWNCESCEAQNYLDEKGEITDPPPLDYTAGKRFARSPEVPGTDDTLFCRRCIQNQHLLTASLASYFPSPEAPDYLTYEEKYPKFRESLEERYPQVCRDCAPKVEQRIRDTGYAAKTDHLRRMMDRTRRGQHGNSWDWKQLLVTLGLFLWFASLAGQVTWHAMGALTITQEPDKLQDEDPAASPGSCFQQSLQLQHVDPSCARVYHPFAGLALAISVLCIAWNPKLGEKLRRKEGRIVGLTEYYKLQILLLAIKFIAWLVLSSCSSFYLEPQTMKAAHAIMIVVSILVRLPQLKALPSA